MSPLEILSDDRREGRTKLRIATFAVPLSGNKGSASMLIGLIDGLKAKNYDVDALVYSYYPKRDREFAASMPWVRVRRGHPRHLVFLVPWLAFLKVARFVLTCVAPPCI